MHPGTEQYRAALHCTARCTAVPVPVPVRSANAVQVQVRCQVRRGAVQYTDTRQPYNETILVIDFNSPWPTTMCIDMRKGISKLRVGDL